MNCTICDAELWAQMVVRTYRVDFAKVNDSLRVGSVLNHHWHPDIERRIDHYRQMSGEFAHEEASA